MNVERPRPHGVGVAAAPVQVTCCGSGYRARRRSALLLPLEDTFSGKSRGRFAIARVELKQALGVAKVDCTTVERFQDQALDLAPWSGRHATPLLTAGVTNEVGGLTLFKASSCKGFRLLPARRGQRVGPIVAREAAERLPADLADGFDLTGSRQHVVSALGVTLRAPIA